MLLIAALLAAFAGLACLSLAMPRHWAQARASADAGRLALPLRLAGLLLLVLSLAACLTGIPSVGIAIVDWLGLLTLAGLGTALSLTYAPRQLPLLTALASLAACATGLA